MKKYLSFLSFFFFYLQDFKTYVDQACRAAEEFVNIYYETMDKRRRVCTCFTNTLNCFG